MREYRVGTERLIGLMEDAWYHVDVFLIIMSQIGRDLDVVQCNIIY